MSKPKKIEQKAPNAVEAIGYNKCLEEYDIWILEEIRKLRSEYHIDDQGLEEGSCSCFSLFEDSLEQLIQRIRHET